jgi:hypothetical protein
MRIGMSGVTGFGVQPGSDDGFQPYIANSGGGMLIKTCASITCSSHRNSAERLVDGGASIDGYTVKITQVTTLLPGSYSRADLLERDLWLARPVHIGASCR